MHVDVKCNGHDDISKRFNARPLQ